MPPPSATAPCKANAAAPGLIGLQAQWASTVGQNAVLTTGVKTGMWRVEPAIKGDLESLRILQRWFLGRDFAGENVENLSETYALFFSSHVFSSKCCKIIPGNGP